MLETVVALILRILSNPAANVFQKKLVENNSAILTNFYCYLFLSLLCIPFSLKMDWSLFGANFWGYVILAGVLCTAGSICLIKALQTGEMSVLGPINSYKCIVGLIFGFLFLGEIPGISGIIGLILIIFGSWFIFDTVDGGFSFKLFQRKDIILRLCALIFSGCEAVVLKKIILLSSVEKSFILWCFSGVVLSFISIILFRKKIKIFTKKDYVNCFVTAICLGIMQLSTNYVFERMNVGLSLALFQLSTIAAVVFGYKIFHEGNFFKKLAGALIMVIGSCLILL